MNERELTPEETAQASIVAYLDGELPETELGAFERRLATDPALAGEVDEMRSLDALLDLYDVPPSLGEGVAEAVVAQLRPVGILHRLRAPLAAAAVVLISLVVTLAILGQDETPTEEVTNNRAQMTETEKVIANLHVIQVREMEAVGLDSSEIAFLMVAREESGTGR